MDTLRQLPELEAYTLHHEIGGGAAARVFLAEQRQPRRQCALKLVDLNAFDNPGIAHALQREGDTVGALSHENIITIYECGVVERFYFIAMECLEGGDLGARIAEGLGWRDALTIARSIADALAHAHVHGIIHRDLKPANVLFHSNGKPVLCDFGIAKIVNQESELTRINVAAGTPYYMPPEQHSGRGVTPRSDLYSLGVVMFEMLTGRKPFTGRSVQAVHAAHRSEPVPAMPPGCAAVEPLVQALLAKDPNDRPGDAGEVADEIERVLEGAGGGTLPRADTRIHAERDDDATVRAPVEVSLPGRVGRFIGVGSVLRERFRIEAVLGEGGMGTVYYTLDLLKQEARDEDPYVALKVLHPKIASAEVTFMALQREAKRSQDLAHPNIVTVFDLDRVDGIVYMTMEYLRGEGADQRLAREPEGLEPSVARKLVMDAVAGLAYAHERGITHADLKPQNLFLCEDGRTKLLDFGIARAHRASKADEVEELFSGYTPAYASPEILAGNKAKPADDVYALGCIAYYCFTGRHPFDKLPANEAQRRGLRPKRPRSMGRAEWSAVASALRFEGAKRPEDAAAFRKRFAPSRAKQAAVGVSALSIAASVAVAVTFSGDQGPEVPFEELPRDTRARIDRSIEEAQIFVDNDNFNAALLHYDNVLKLHPGNRRATGGMVDVVDRVLQRVQYETERDVMSPDSARATLNTLLSYKTLPESARKEVRQAKAAL